MSQSFIRLFILLLALAVSCGGASTADTNSGTEAEIRDSAGVRWVLNRGQVWGDSAPWQVSPQPILRIGAVEGEEPYLFGSIGGVTRLSDGRIVVLDAMAREIRAFSPTGEHLWSAGRRGRGPGEFTSPTNLQRLERDVLQVEDMHNRIRYSADGNLIEHVMVDWGRIAELGEYTWDCRVVPRFLAEGLLISGAACAIDAREHVSESGVRSSATMLIYLPWSLDAADTLDSFVLSEEWVHSFRGRPYPIRLPLSPRGLFATGGTPVRLAYALTSRYRVDVYDVKEARLLLRIERPGHTHVPTTEEVAAGWAEWDRQVEIRRGFRVGGNDLARELSSLKGLVPLPDSVSVLDQLIIDDLNYVWVGHRIEDGSDSRSWAIFREDGVLLGEIQLPASLHIDEVGSDYILGIELDENSVPYVILLDLQR